jgi:hypothetical protein
MKNVKNELRQELKLFFNGRPCNFPGWQDLQNRYSQVTKNLGPGCAPCKRNALKRKFAAKIEKLIRFKYVQAAKARSK